MNDLFSVQQNCKNCSEIEEINAMFCPTRQFIHIYHFLVHYSITSTETEIHPEFSMQWDRYLILSFVRWRKFRLWSPGLWHKVASYVVSSISKEPTLSFFHGSMFPRGTGNHLLNYTEDHKPKCVMFCHPSFFLQSLVQNIPIVSTHSMGEQNVIIITVTNTTCSILNIIISLLIPI
jgi:hypothetical protein